MRMRIEVSTAGATRRLLRRLAVLAARAESVQTPAAATARARPRRAAKAEVRDGGPSVGEARHGQRGA